MREPGIKKLYYSIGEVSELTGLDAHVIRYWEGEFEELKPRKNRAGRRIYTDDDIVVLQRIQKLLRDDKYTIEGARQVLGRDDLPARERLLELRAFLLDLRDRLAARRRESAPEEAGEPDPLAAEDPQAEDRVEGA